MKPYAIGQREEVPVRRYLLAMNDNHEGVIEMVNALMEKGWRCTGGITVWDGILVQAMIRSDEFSPLSGRHGEGTNGN